MRHKEQRVLVLFDVQNLYYSAKHLYNQKVNFKAILNEAVGGRKLIRAIAYVIKTDIKEESNFHDALNNVGIEVKSKELQVFYGGAKKGDWDIGIAMDAVRMANKIDTLVMVSGDGDFKDLLAYMKSHGCRTEVIALGKTASKMLKEEAELFVDMEEKIDKYLIGNNHSGNSNQSQSARKSRSAKKTTSGAQSSSSSSTAQASGSSKENLDENKKPTQSDTSKESRGSGDSSNLDIITSKLSGKSEGKSFQMPGATEGKDEEKTVTKKETNESGNKSSQQSETKKKTGKTVKKATKKKQGGSEEKTQKNESKAKKSDSKGEKSSSESDKKEKKGFASRLKKLISE